MSKTSPSSNFKGIACGFLGAIGIGGYALINRYVYLNYDVNTYDYTATFVIAAGFFAFFSLLADGRTASLVQKKRQTLGMMFNGLVATIAIALIAFGQRYTTAVNASIIVSASTLPTIFFSWLLLKSSMSRRQFAWIAVLFIGLYFAIVGTHLLTFRTGDLIILSSIILLGFSNTYSRILMRHNHSSTVADTRLITGGLLFVTLELLFQGPSFLVTQAGLWPLVAGFSLWFAIKTFYVAVQYLNPSKAIVITNSHPMFTPIFGVLLLGEPYSWVKLLGTLVILLSIYNISKK